MEADRSEINDLVDAHADIVKELAELHDAWAKRCGVIPWDELNEMRKRRFCQKFNKKYEDEMKAGIG